MSEALRGGDHITWSLFEQGPSPRPPVTGLEQTSWWPRARVRGKGRFSVPSEPFEHFLKGASGQDKWEASSHPGPKPP